MNSEKNIFGRSKKLTYFFTRNVPGEETIKSCNIGQIDDVRKPVSYGELSTRRDWTKNAGKTLFPGKKVRMVRAPSTFHT